MSVLHHDVSLAACKILFSLDKSEHSLPEVEGDGVVKVDIEKLTNLLSVLEHSIYLLLRSIESLLRTTFPVAYRWRLTGSGECCNFFKSFAVVHGYLLHSSAALYPSEPDLDIVASCVTVSPSAVEEKCSLSGCWDDPTTVLPFTPADITASS